MPFEARRGCGFREVGKLYLCGSGMALPCDGLPLQLTACNCCGYIPEFYRGFRWIPKTYIIQKVTEQHKPECNCIELCPICHPENNQLEKYGLMWVGKKYYSPRSFVLESQEMGVSKAIPEIPKDLVIGETWVMLVHPEVTIHEDPEYLRQMKNWPLEAGPAPEPPKKPAIFYAFQPSTVEMPIWENEATPERLTELREKGITPIIIEQTQSNLEAHAPRKGHGRKRGSKNGQSVLERWDGGGDE